MVFTDDLTLLINLELKKEEEAGKNMIWQAIARTWEGLEAARNICTRGQGYFSSSGGDLDMLVGFRWNSSNVCMTKITSYS